MNYLKNVSNFMPARLSKSKNWTLMTTFSKRNLGAYI